MDKKIYFKGIIIGLGIILCTSCKTKKKIVETETIKSDTLIIKEEVVKAPLINDVITLKEICKDSTATEFKRIFVRDKDSFDIEIKDNTLQIKINQKERELTRLEKEYRSIKESYKKLEEKKMLASKLLKWLYVFCGFASAFVLYCFFPSLFSWSRTGLFKLLKLS